MRKKGYEGSGQREQALGHVARRTFSWTEEIRLYPPAVATDTPDRGNLGRQGTIKVLIRRNNEEATADEPPERTKCGLVEGTPYPLYFARRYGFLWGRIVALAKLRRHNRFPADSRNCDSG